MTFIPRSTTTTTTTLNVLRDYMNTSYDPYYVKERNAIFGQVPNEKVGEEDDERRAGKKANTAQEEERKMRVLMTAMAQRTERERGFGYIDVFFFSRFISALYWSLFLSYGFVLCVSFFFSASSFLSLFFLVHILFAYY